MTMVGTRVEIVRDRGGVRESEEVRRGRKHVDLDISSLVCDVHG